MRLPLPALLLFLTATPLLAADGLSGKVFIGYQGWFAPTVEGTGARWVHYGHQGKFEPAHASVEMWPDVSDLPAADRVATAFKHPDGRPAEVFSSARPATVDTHFAWMKEHGVDGAFLQRFGASVNSKGVAPHLARVLDNVRKSAGTHGRSYCIMYDLSGLKRGQIRSVVMEDWRRLVTEAKVRDDRTYLKHAGKPLVAVWGIGFNDNRDYTLAECMELVKFLQNDPAAGGNAVMVGVPFYWRTSNRDADPDPLLHEIIAQADVVSPWSVGRYAKPQQLTKMRTDVYEPDIKWLADRGAKGAREIAYLPVVFPGFSWRNLQKLRGKDAPLDAIPRLGGQFMWSQAVAARRAGANTIYVAMFDEIDEGTAVFKVSADPPEGFLKLDTPRSDHYLWLTGEVGRMLRGQAEARDEMPARK
ncbi:MAG TPA: glycoside hydrolase family 71/99-like protein [Tepidisphaeraceae bacterium]|nr:glycoside hydrolase family 71/99-like protein [Tepidisphaeraceae bacterium]